MKTNKLSHDEEYAKISKRLKEIQNEKAVLEKIIDLPQYYGYSNEIFEYAIIVINRENDRLDLQIEEEKQKLILYFPYINYEDSKIFSDALNTYINSLNGYIQEGHIMIYTYLDKNILDVFTINIKEILSKKEANNILLDEIKRLIIEQEELIFKEKEIKRKLGLNKVQRIFNFFAEKKD